MARTEQVEAVEVALDRARSCTTNWQTLELRWLPVELSDADFKETLTPFAEMADSCR